MVSVIAFVVIALAGIVLVGIAPAIGAIVFLTGIIGIAVTL